MFPEFICKIGWLKPGIHFYKNSIIDGGQDSMIVRKSNLNLDRSFRKGKIINKTVIILRTMCNKQFRKDILREIRAIWIK